MRVTISCVYLLATLVTAVSAFTVWRHRRRSPAAVGFAAVLTSGALWSVLVLLENVAPWPWVRVAALHVWVLAPRLAALAFGMLVLRLFDAGLTRLRALAAAYPLTLALILAAPGARPLVIERAAVVGDGTLSWSPGPLFWPVAGVDLMLFCGTCLVLLHGIRHARPSWRRQLWCVLGAGLTVTFSIGGAVAAMLLRGVGSTDSFDFSVLGFVAAAVAFQWWVLTDGVLTPPRDGAGLRGLVVDRLEDAAVVVDRSGCVVDVNPAAHVLLGRAALVGCTVREALDRLGPEVLDRTGEYHLPQGRGRDIKVVASPLADDDEQLGRLLLLSDVTSAERDRALHVGTIRSLRRQVENLTALAAVVDDSTLRDPLTGLANRRHLLDCLDALVAGAHESRLGCTVVRLALVPLPGPAVPGEDVVRAFARLLVETAPTGSICGVLPDAGYAVVVSGADPAAGHDIAARLRDRMALTPELAGHVLVSGSATLVHPGEQPYALLARADEALERARHEGAGPVVPAD